MTRIYKIVLLTVFITVIVPLILLGSCAIRAKQYERSFSQIEVGQQKETVINLMGKPSEIQICNFSVYDSDKKHISDCFEIFVYNLPYHQWGFAFDKTEKLSKNTIGF